MISAFGPRARAYVEGLGDLEAVVADMTMLGPAYAEAVRRRTLGQAFYGMVIFEERRAQTTLACAGPVLGQIADFDERCAALDQLGTGRLVVDGKPAESLWELPAATGKIVAEFLALADVTLVRSYAEAARLGALGPRPRSIEPVLSVPRVPAVRPRLGKRPAVVIWAPDRPAPFVAWYAFALAEFFGDVTCVTSGGGVPSGLTARFVSPLDPALAEILAGAPCVVCPEPDDPGAAVAFARAGFGVAAPLASGAQEYVRDIASFELARLRDVAIAVQIAIGRPASVRSLPQPLPVPAVPALPLDAAGLPLVSVIVGTYNRPDDLTRCLRDLSRQTYPQLEIVVFNDAGENVDHIVARFPKARIVNFPVNGGSLRLVVEAFNHIQGSYVQLLADDDTLYPDHVERLMGAMLRSGACVAHGNTLMRYQQRREGGAVVTSGYNAIVFGDSATPSEALISTPIAGNSIIIRRDIIDAIGGYSERTALADQEFQLRAAGRYVFAYVDAYTAEWRVRRGENQSSRTDGGEELRKVYEVLHPRPERPRIEDLRRAALAGFAGRPKGYIFEPTVLVRDPAGP